jgi:prephenate dehydrogenase
MTVAILGFGRFGRALGELLGEAGIAYRALDPNVDVPEHVRADSLRSLVLGAEIIVVSVPVPRIRSSLVDLKPHLTREQIVIDVGSVKVHPMEALTDVLGADVPFVATHPLFGPLSLALAERPLRVVVCPSPLHPAAADRVRALYERIGCEVIEQTAEGHDRVMAHTHALTFFVAKGMIDAGAGMDVPFAPASFQAIARTIETVRSDAGHLFVAIQNENPFAAEARATLVESLRAIDKALATPRDTSPDATPDSTRLAIPDLGARSPALAEARAHIDGIDREIVGLLARRAQIAQRAAKAKAEIGAPVLDASREASLLQARRDWARASGLDAEGVEEIFRAVVRFSRRLQRT